MRLHFSAVTGLMVSSLLLAAGAHAQIVPPPPPPPPPGQTATPPDDTFNPPMPTQAQMQQAYGITQVTSNATYVEYNVGMASGKLVISKTLPASRAAAKAFCSSLPGFSLLDVNGAMLAASIVVALPELTPTIINPKIQVEANNTDGGGIAVWVQSADAPTDAALGNNLMIFTNGDGEGHSINETLAALNTQAATSGQPSIAGIPALCVDQGIANFIKQSMAN